METRTPKAEAAREGAGADLIGRHTRLARRTALISVLTLFSRVLGYVREMISAALFGDQSAVYDAFITAWRVPNLFRRFLGEGALSTSFQTVLTGVEGDQGEVAGRRLLHETLRLLFWILLALCAVVMAGITLVPDAMPITGWHWLGADPEPVRDLTVRVMPFVVLVCLAALIGGALNVRGHFAAPAWSPAAMNLVWIGTLCLIAWRFGWSPSDPADEGGRHLAMTHWLAWGVLLSGLVQLLVQVPALVRHGLLVRSRAGDLAGDGSAAMGVLKRSAPLAIGAAVYQINVMIDGLMAESLLPNGGPTLHYYANRVQQFPMALIAIAATSAVFPALQAYGHDRNRHAVRRLHDRTQRAICFVALPASISLMWLAHPVIAVSFERGAFGGDGVTRATDALRMLTLAILPAGAVGLLARTYYAMGDFKTPVRVSIVMLIANIGLNVVCIRSLGMDVDGLALATAVTSWGSFFALLPGLRSRLRLPAGELALFRPIGIMLGCAVSAGAAARWVDTALGERPAVALLAAIATGIVVYFTLARLAGVPEAEELARKLRRGRGARGA